MSSRVTIFLSDIASLRFQPTKRPQITSQKQKPKAFVSKSSAPATTTIPPTITSSDQRPNRGPSTVKSSLADWAATGDDEDVNGFYGGEKRQRGGRKKRKKNKEESHVFQNWDDIYDPARPNSYEEYKNSDEKILEVREWKERLYAHRRGRENLSELDSDEDSRPVFKMSGKKFCLFRLSTSNVSQGNLRRRPCLLHHHISNIIGRRLTTMT